MDGGDNERGYHYRRHRVSGSVDVVYSNIPEKNEASHIADAEQYGCLYINHEKQSRSPEAGVIMHSLQKKLRARRSILGV